MNPNLTPRAGTLRELKRQRNYLVTIIKRSDEKHEAIQAKRLQKAEKIDGQIALAEALETELQEAETK